jgi:hypothetical protein
MFAHAYVLAISSSDLRLLIWERDWARSELAKSINSGGRAPEWRGIRFSRAWWTGLPILFILLCCVSVKMKIFEETAVEGRRCLRARS